MTIRTGEDNKDRDVFLIGDAPVFLFMHFLSFHRATPPPNTLQPWFLGLAAAVFALRGAAYVLTVRAKGKSRPEEMGGDRATIST